MNTPKKTARRQKIKIAIVCLPVLYVLSYGPLTWFASRGKLKEPFLTFANGYITPLNWTYRNGPEWWQRTLRGYRNLWRADRV